MPAGPELAGAAADYYRRNRTFLAAFEPAREESFFTQEGQRSLLTEEARLAEEDRSYLSKRYMEYQIVALLGGRVAEKLCLGDISTGASNDIQRASQIARKMVASYGMSDEIGTVSFESGHDEVFIGRTMTQGRSYSEAVAAQIDREVQRVVGNAYDRCEEILKEQRQALDTVAKYLLEHETMERAEFLAVFGEKEEKELPL